jgi:uncharacterized protein DUF1573/HYDIN/CFA65/VesB family protein
MSKRIFAVSAFVVFLLAGGLLLVKPPWRWKSADIPVTKGSVPDRSVKPDTPFLHDFGKVMEGDTPSHTFTFTNTTDQPLKVLKVRIPCGCAKTGVEKKELAPGESTPLTVTFISAKLLGKINKNVYVLTDAPDLAMVKYAIQAGVVQKPAPSCVVSRRLRLGTVTTGQTITGKLSVDNSGQLDLSVAPKTLPEGISMANKFPVVIKPGEKAELELAYAAPAHQGKQRLKLFLETNDPRHLQVRITIQAEVLAAAASAEKQD